MELELVLLSYCVCACACVFVYEREYTGNTHRFVLHIKILPLFNYPLSKYKRIYLAGYSQSPGWKFKSILIGFKVQKSYKPIFNNFRKE